ncbi:MAG TPA: ABC transporter ATP-binding protein [Kineosporiaceae bacterium]|nr:ABC transporter ATP-binding protein [Kineosporiaceae bacterium]
MTSTTAAVTPVPVGGAPVLQGRGLRKSYGSTTALDGVDLEIRAGDSIAIMGPSGSGKTTLMQVLAGIITPDSGVVRLRGEDVQGLSAERRAKLRRTEYGFVFQSGQLLAELTAVENVALPLMVAGIHRKQAVAQARAWFAPLGLDGREQQRPGELSGGQMQRVAIARALVTRPGIVFADEPTGALDQETGGEVMELLTRTHAENGAALVVITHDPQVARWCGRIVEVRDGKIMAGSR